MRRPSITISKELFGDFLMQNGHIGLEQCKHLLGAAIRELAHETKSAVIVVEIVDEKTKSHEEVLVPVSSVGASLVEENTKTQTPHNQNQSK